MMVNQHSPAALRRAMRIAAIESLNNVTAEAVKDYGTAAFEASEAVREACVQVIAISLALYTHPGDHDRLIRELTERLTTCVELSREDGLRRRTAASEMVQ